MTAPRLISPAKLRAYAEQCRALGVVVEVKPDGTVRLIPQRQEGEENTCDKAFGCASGNDHPADAWQDCLYRYYGYDRALLYIGITNNFFRRNKQHWDSIWRGTAQYVRVEAFPNRDVCELAEAHAIADEKPPFNSVRPYAWPVDTIQHPKIRPYLNANGGVLSGRDVQWLCECGTPIEQPFEPTISYQVAK